MNKKKTIRLNVICLLIMFVVLSMSYYYLSSGNENIHENASIALQEKKDYVYLSDIDYITENNWSYNGWSGHEIQKDKNQDGGALSLIVDGEKRSYVKGVGIHAKGQLTYDISAFSTEYPRFIAKIGVDASRGANGSVWFKITASHDGEDWSTVLLDKTAILTGQSNAIDVDVNIEGFRYLRIYVDPNGANASDHGTIANAKLVKKIM